MKLQSAPTSALLPTLLLTILLPALSAAEPVRDGEFHGRPALVLSNDKLELSVLPLGGAMVQLLLHDDAGKTFEKSGPSWRAASATWCPCCTPPSLD